MRSVMVAPLCAVVIAACSGGSSAPQSQPPSSYPSAPVVTDGPSSSPSADPGADCRTSHLSISTKDVEAGAGHGGIVIVFTNRGPTCTMRAYPGVDGLASNGQPVVHAKRTPSGYLGGPGKTTSVSLETGDVASALFEGLNAPPEGGPPCPSYNEIAITPPDETHSVRRSSPRVCEPEIHPVTEGSDGGRPPPA